MQDLTSTRPLVVLPRRYLGVPEKAACRVVACGGGGEPFAAATAAVTAVVNSTDPRHAALEGPGIWY